MIHTKRRALSFVLGTLLLAGSVAATQGAALAASPVAANHAVVKVIREAKFGQILVTPKGFALYYFTPEKHGAIKCTGACAKVWPPMLLAAGIHAPMHISGVMGTFSTVARPDKTQQLTFDGKPLYTFTSDKQAGQVLCDGVGGWYVVRVQ